SDRHLLALALALPRRLDSRKLAELLVGEAPAEVREGLALVAVVEPALDEALDGLVELLREDAAEERAADRGARAEPAPDEDVVSLAPAPLVVAGRRALEAKVGDPVLGARVRAAVEVEPELGDVLAEALLQPLDQPAEPRLRLGDGEVAVRLARARDPGGADVVDVEREADRGHLGDRRVDLGLGHVRDDEVLLPRDADVAAEPLGDVGDRDHLVARDEAEVDGEADVAQAGLLLRVDADVVARLDRDRRQLEVLERAAELGLDAL